MMVGSHGQELFDIIKNLIILKDIELEEFFSDCWINSVKTFARVPSISVFVCIWLEIYNFNFAGFSMPVLTGPAGLAVLD